MVLVLCCFVFFVYFVFFFFQAEDGIRDAQESRGLGDVYKRQGFFYIAGSDLVPLIKNQKSLKKSLVFFLAMILGTALMYLLLLVE